MKRIIGIFAALLLPLTGSAQLYIDPVKDVEAEIFIPKVRYKRAQQGMEIYKDLIFSVEDGGHVNVYDFKTADVKPIAMFELGSSMKDNHANNASFGIETKKGASFPLLYISVGKPGADIDLICFVESITKKGKKFSSELVQKIHLDIEGWAEAGYVPMFGAPSWMVDQKRGDLWVFSARKRTTPKITLNNWENQYIATKFRVPALSEGADVYLDVDDILQQVVLPYDTGFTQAGDVYDGQLVYGYGVGQQDDTRPSRIRIYDLDRREIVARYNVQEELPLEIEDVKFYNGYLYVNNNTSPKKTTVPPSIYKVALPKPVPAPENAIEELRQSPEKAAGAYYVTDLAAKEITPAPKGFEPFYINGYFRHGARQIDDPVTYVRIYECMETAQATDNLTDFGLAMYQRLAGQKQNVYYREGDLTQIGYKQHFELGKRMVENYPSVFQGNAYLKANATNVLRVAASMQSFALGVTSKRPDLPWAEIDNSKAHLSTVHPYGTQCPTKKPIDVRMYTHDSPWFKLYSEYRASRINPDIFLQRMFKDIEVVKAKYEPFDLVWRFWLMACVQQCLDRNVPMWDLFTEDEILAWAEVENYCFYVQKSKDPSNFGRGWGLSAYTLRHILEESAKDIELGRHGANLNFGHDGSVTCLLVNLDADNWGKTAEKPEDVINIWQNWNIPMASNIQFVFYRNAAGEIIIKVMHNEKDVKLPVKEYAPGFYKWEDFYSYYDAHCDKVMEMLDKTENINY